jgi:hypothetical protein
MIPEREVGLCSEGSERVRHDREMRAEAANRAVPTTPGLCCPGCGFVPSCWPQARTLRADLGVVWLVSANGGLRESRFCRACAPPELVGEIACAVCADGPLLAGEFTEDSLSTWLTERGWQARGDSRDRWLCPRCTPLI